MKYWNLLIKVRDNVKNENIVADIVRYLKHYNTSGASMLNDEIESYLERHPETLPYLEEYRRTL